MKTTADLVITGGKLWSHGAPLRGADALAVAGGRILALAPLPEIEPLIGPRTRRVDAAGGTVTPGITDAHIHLVQWGVARGELRLEGLRSRSDVLAAVTEHVRTHPSLPVAVGRGWDARDWTEPPELAALDRATGSRPVLLHSRDFHALWVNRAALERAGVTSTTADPAGGRFERDAAGELTGVVREHAVRRFAELMPAPSFDSLLASTRSAASALLAEGVTCVHDFEGPRDLPVVRALAQGEGPRVRALMNLSHDGLEPALGLGLGSGVGDDDFRLGAIKLFADGTLGSRTAAMLDPYDDSDERGLDLIPAAELEALVKRAFAGGLAVAVHAIGDRAVRHALDAFAAAAATPSRTPRLASRIEHAQLVHPTDVVRFAALGVVASMQPVHCTSDLELVERHWSRRREHSYPWRSLLASGARLAFGSDAPVEPPSVAHGLQAAVSRRRPDGTPAVGFVPGECVDLDAALTAYTETPARLAGQWPRLGCLAAGALADVVVWSDDLHRTPPERLHEVKPAATVLAGEIVHLGIAVASGARAIQAAGS
ncbi:MAG TPA: amidohydrolase [Candidatus Limnocylindria bacterium]|nr:amidohydrolase [Candidatus Limnocylindria bacterium]